MNYAGKFDATFAADGPSPESLGHGRVETITKHAVQAPADAIIVPDSQLLFNGDFKRSGVDLVLSRDDHELVLHDYFKGEKRAPLASPDGAHLTGEIVNALTGHTQYAQAGGGAAAGQVIGHVSKLSGTATAVRNGVSIILNNGDNVEKGDVVQSGSDSTLGITFIDGTVFGLSSNARMVLNEMVYDPNGSNNSSLLSLVAGTISFVAGGTAKHGDMKVDTPVATMGIRGTAVLVEIDFNVPGQGGAPDAKFQVLVEPDGTTGSYILFDKNTLTPIATVNQAGQQINISQGQVSITNSPLPPEIQKLITDVFALKSTDNSNPKTLDHFTDIGIPQPLQPIYLPSGTSATPVIVNVINFADNTPKQLFTLASDPNPHIPGPPTAVIIDPATGKPTQGFKLGELPGRTHDAVDPDTVSIKVNWADVNAGDVPSALVKFVSFAYQNASHNDISAALNGQQLADIAAVELNLNAVSDPGNKNHGSATITYSLPDAAFDFLAAGETVTLTYLVEVHNNFALNDEVTRLPVTITITGTNDVPVITSSAPTIVFSGGTSVPGGPLTTQVPTSGVLAFGDVDLTDTHTVSAKLTGAVGVLDGNTVLNGVDKLPPGPLALLEAALSASIAGDSTGTGSGTINWKLADLPVYVADFLAKGEILTLTYTVTLTDSQGATTTQDVTVSITGTDKPAVVWIDTNPVPSSGALWSGASNWETGTVPTANDDAIVITDQLHGLTPSFPLTIDAPAFAKSLTMNDFGTLPPEVDNKSTLAIGDKLSLSADSIFKNFGSLSVGGPAEILDHSVLQNSGTITLWQGGDFTTSVAITNSGTIEVDGGTLHIGGDIANTGGQIIVKGIPVITLNAAADSVFTLVDSDTTTVVLSPASLVLNAATINGGIVTNQFGLLDLAGAGILAGGSLANAGMIKVTGSGNALHDETVTVNYALEVMAGGALLLDLGASIANAGGTVTIDDAGTLTLNGATIDGGTINIVGTLEATGTSTISNANITNTGLIEAADGILTIDPTALATLVNSGTLGANGGELDLVGETVTNTGALQAIGDGMLKLMDTTVTNTDGVADNPTGTVTVESGSTLVLAGAVINGGSLGNAGQIDIGGAGNALDGVTVTANHGLEILSGGTLLLDLGTTIDNAGGIITVDGTATLTLNGAAIEGGTITDSGTIDAVGGSNTIGIGTAVINYGTIEATGGTLTIHDAIVNAGTLKAEGGTLVVDGDISGAGTATIGNGGTLDLGGTDAQTVTFDGLGTLRLEASSHFTGTISGLAAGDIIDLAGTVVTSAYFEGSTLYVNGQPTTFDVSVPAGDTIAFKGDGSGGTNLKVSPQVLGVGTPAPAAGVEGAAIHLAFSDTITGASLASFVIGGIPAGAVITDGTPGHIYTSGMGGGSVDVAAWNLSNLTITPADTANFTLKALVTAVDGDGYDYSLPETEIVVVSPAAPTVAPVAASGLEGTAIALDLGTTVNGQPGDSNTLASLLVGMIPVGATLSDGHGHSFTAAAGSTSVDIHGWDLAGLTITPVGDVNFALQISATTRDADGDLSAAATATEAVTVTPAAPTVAPVAASGVEGTAIAIDLGVTSNGQFGDSLALLVVGTIPVGATLSDGHGHSFTAVAGSTSIDVHDWTLSGLTITPANDTNFSLQITATTQDADGNLSTPATATEAVTVVPAAPALAPVASSGVEGTAIALDLGVAPNGQSGDSNSLASLLVGTIPVGATLSDGYGHSFTATVGSTSVDVHGWTLSGLTITPANDTNFSLQITATTQDSDGNLSAPATATEAVTVAPEAPTVAPVAASGFEGTAIALDLGTTVNGLPGDSNSLASLVVSTIPVGATLSDGHGHSFTAVAGSTSIDVHGWSLSSLTVTPDDATSFTLHVAATAHDAEGNPSAMANGIEAVTVTPDVPVIVGETNPAEQAVIVVTPGEPVVLAPGGTTNTLGLNTETFDGQSRGSVSNNGLGHGNFHSAALNATFSASGHAGVVEGSSGVSSAPFIGPLPGGTDATNYLSIGGGASETITFQTEENAFGLYWGSVDPYNTISFYHGGTLVASYTGADIAPLLANGGQGSFASNGYVEFYGLSSFDKVVLSSSSNAFEVDNISAGSISGPHAGLAAPVAGTLSVHDTTVGDTLTASVLGNAIVSYNGSTTLPGGVNVAGLIDAGDVTFDSVTSDGGTDVLNWTYHPGNANLDFLKAGDTLTLTFSAQVSNGVNVSAVQPLTISIAGANTSADLSQFKFVSGTSQNDTFGDVHGNVTVFGGGGQDTFVFKPNFGNPTIADFDVNNDTIDISHTLFNSVASILAGAHSANSGHDTVITDSHHDTITLLGVTVAQLQQHPTDFHLV